MGRSPYVRSAHDRYTHMYLYCSSCYTEYCISNTHASVRRAARPAVGSAIAQRAVCAHARTPSATAAAARAARVVRRPRADVDAAARGCCCCCRGCCRCSCCRGCCRGCCCCCCRRCCCRRCWSTRRTGRAHLRARPLLSVVRGSNPHAPSAALVLLVPLPLPLPRSILTTITRRPAGRLARLG